MAYRHPGLSVGAAHVPVAEICKTRNKCWEFYRWTRWSLDVALNPGACFKAVWLCRFFSTVFGGVIACSPTSAGSTADLVGLVWELLSCKSCPLHVALFSCGPSSSFREKEPWLVGNKSSIQREQMMPFWYRSMTVPPGRCGFAMQFDILTWAVSSPKYICSIRTKLFLSYFFNRSENSAVGQLLEFLFCLLLVKALQCQEWSNWNFLRVLGMQWNVRLIYSWLMSSF